MATRKLKAGFKSLFLLVILLVISALTAIIGKSSSNKNSDSFVAQAGLINTVNADDIGGGGGDAGCCGSGASESSSGSY